MHTALKISSLRSIPPVTHRMITGISTPLCGHTEKYTEKEKRMLIDWEIKGNLFILRHGKSLSERTVEVFTNEKDFKDALTRIDNPPKGTSDRI